jgi:hypothetical protein
MTNNANAKNKGDGLLCSILCYKRAKKINKQTMAYSRFASLNESELSKLLADKDSESTKKATKG